METVSAFDLSGRVKTGKLHGGRIFQAIKVYIIVIMRHLYSGKPLSLLMEHLIAWALRKKQAGKDPLPKVTVSYPRRGYILLNGFIVCRLGMERPA